METNQTPVKCASLSSVPGEIFISTDQNERGEMNWKRVKLPNSNRFVSFEYLKSLGVDAIDVVSLWGGN
jgi:hypothetical protein